MTEGVIKISEININVPPINDGDYLLGNKVVNGIPTSVTFPFLSIKQYVADLQTGTGGKASIYTASNGLPPSNSEGINGDIYLVGLEEDTILYQKIDNDWKNLYVFKGGQEVPIATTLALGTIKLGADLTGTAYGVLLNKVNAQLDLVDNTRDIDKPISDLTKASIANEVADRIASDNQLGDYIDNLEYADGAINIRIDNAIVTLNSDISKEINDRTNADTLIYNAIDAEKTQRETSDTQLQAQIDGFVSISGSAIDEKTQTYADMISIDPSSLIDGYTVLVLQDESRDNLSTLYTVSSGYWTFFGYLSSSYSKSEIDSLLTIKINKSDKAVDFSVINDILIPTTNATASHVTTAIQTREPSVNKVIDFVTTDNVTFPTTRAVEQYVEGKNYQLVSNIAQLTSPSSADAYPSVNLMNQQLSGKSNITHEHPLYDVLNAGSSAILQEKVFEITAFHTVGGIKNRKRIAVLNNQILIGTYRDEVIAQDSDNFSFLTNSGNNYILRNSVRSTNAISEIILYENSSVMRTREQVTSDPLLPAKSVSLTISKDDVLLTFVRPRTLVPSSVLTKSDYDTLIAVFQKKLPKKYKTQTPLGLQFNATTINETKIDLSLFSSQIENYSPFSEIYTVDTLNKGIKIEKTGYYSIRFKVYGKLDTLSSGFTGTGTLMGCTFRLYGTSATQSAQYKKTTIIGMMNVKWYINAEVVFDRVFIDASVTQPLLELGVTIDKTTGGVFDTTIGILTADNSLEIEYLEVI